MALTRVFAGIITSMRRLRKITVEVDARLLQRAQKQSRDGVTGTVRRGLEILAAADAYEKLARMRGKVKFSTSLETMRNDRR
jgi:hypothetical protein